MKDILVIKQIIDKYKRKKKRRRKDSDLKKGNCKKKKRKKKDKGRRKELEKISLKCNIYVLMRIIIGVN
jgi:hypothetical protein